MMLNAKADDIAVKSRSGDGSFITPTPSEAKGDFPFGYSRRYDGPNKPIGAWRLENIAGGLTVVHNFTASDIETCNLRTYPEVSAALMEIQTPVKDIPAGGRIAIKHSLEIKE